MSEREISGAANQSRKSTEIAGLGRKKPLLKSRKVDYRVARVNVAILLAPTQTRFAAALLHRRYFGISGNLTELYHAKTSRDDSPPEEVVPGSPLLLFRTAESQSYARGKTASSF